LFTAFAVLSTAFAVLSTALPAALVACWTALPPVLLVAPDDPEALAEGLYSLWHNPELAQTLGAHGFDGVREHYRVQRSADRQLDIYERLVARPNDTFDAPRRASQ